VEGKGRVGEGRKKEGRERRSDCMEEREKRRKKGKDSIPPYKYATVLAGSEE